MRGLYHGFRVEFVQFRFDSAKCNTKSHTGLPQNSGYPVQFLACLSPSVETQRLYRSGPVGVRPIDLLLCR